jgi:superfamily II DNA helicase RecQ
MPFKFCFIPVRDSEAVESELNAFLRNHKILDVDRRWIEQGANSYWSFCIDYVDGSGASGNTNGRYTGSRSKVDYKEVLKPEDFSVFARLREVRKEIATSEAVPVYTIFTNDQLAQMVQSRATSKSALEKIAGVGDARLEKYGARMLDVLTQAWKPVDEANRKPL